MEFYFKKNMRNFFCFLIFTLSLVVSSHVKASGSEMSDFLKSCGYGTLGGAVAGVVSLAFIDRPGDQLNNISKGASLGLYFGIGYGLYKIYGTAEEKPGFDYQLSLQPIDINGDKNLIPYAQIIYRL